MMAEELFPIALTCPATLRVERLRDFQIPIELNCAAYGVPLEAAKPSTLSERLAQSAFIYVGYVADRPVCTATVLIQDDLLYLALVATDENARNQGYGEAIVRHALQKAHEATTLTKATLDSTAAGRPVYTRIGFRSVADFQWYAQRHD
jgi:GNAT superfamily N-acetyltransferase